MGVGMETGVKGVYFYRNLGIPGQSGNLICHAQLTVGIGGPNPFLKRSYLQQGPSRWNFSYYMVSYRANDGTSQMSAGFVTEHSLRSSRTVFQYENDMFWLARRDEYRTSFAALWWDWMRGTQVVGVGIGSILWTGTTSGLGKHFAGETYNLSEQYGGKYTHGILFAAIRYGIFILRVGYDSETIRNAFQNSLHRLVNDGAIPMLPRESRVFIELSVFDGGPLY